MSMGDDLRAQVEIVLDEIAAAVNHYAEADRHLDRANEEILLMGITGSNHSIAGSVGIGQVAKNMGEIYINNLFILRERVTIYRDGLQ